MNNAAAIIIEPKTPATSSIIWLHGLGASGDDFVPLVPALDLPSTRFIFPHAPIRKITINMGMEMRGWYDILGFDRNAQQDEAGIKQACTFAHELIAAEIAKGITADNIIVAGFSQGCAIALYAGLLYQNSLGGIIALSGYLPLADALQKELASKNSNTPIFMAHGNSDSVLPVDYAHRSHAFLQTMGYTIDFHTYPIAHTVSDAEVRDIKNWLNKKL